MKGYKALNMDMSSKYGGMAYEIGKKYTIAGKLKMCKNGFHFCKHLEDVENYYEIVKSRIFEVEAEGEIIDEDDKSCAESITLIRELSKEEIHQYFVDSKERILEKNWCCRKALADQRICLDKLVHDDDGRVRATVAEQGYGLDILIHDEDWRVRVAVAGQNYGLDILVHDENEFVRATVAKQGYGLNILVYDKDLWVRVAVAEQGYGLDILVHDEDWYVQNKAVAKQNGGLMIPISSGISPAQDTKKEKKKWLNFWKK